MALASHSDARVALVTGAAKRVGRAIALELASEGCDIAVHYHESRAQADQVAQEILGLGRRALTIQGDLNIATEWPRVIREAVAALGRLDVLVNNASLFLAGAPDTTEAFDPELWQRMFRVNLLAPVGLTHHAAPHLSARGHGCVINLCDAGIDRPWPDHLAYCASKAALANATRGLARALAPKVRVNGVAPGIAVFPDEYSAALRQRLAARVPLAREGTPEDIAGAVRFLVESGEYITGQIINVDGGRSVA